METGQPLKTIPILVLRICLNHRRSFVIVPVDEHRSFRRFTAGSTAGPGGLPLPDRPMITKTSPLSTERKPVDPDGHPRLLNISSCFALFQQQS